MSLDNKVKYLQMFQDVVKRMADTSAAMKRYAQSHVEQIAKASERGDWRASQALLRVNRLTKEDWGGTTFRGAGDEEFTVVLNIPDPGSPST